MARAASSGVLDKKLKRRSLQILQRAFHVTDKKRNENESESLKGEEPSESVQSKRGPSPRLDWLSRASKEDAPAFDNLRKVSLSMTLSSVLTPTHTVE
jgi:hypothetical protein